MDNMLQDLASENEVAGFRYLMDSIPAYVCLLNPAGEVVDMNNALKRASGMSVMQLVRTPFELAPWWSDDEEAVMVIKNAIAKAQRGETGRCDLSVKSDIGPRIIYMTISPAFSNDRSIVFLTCVAYDVTGQRAKEAAFKENEAYLKFATESAEVGVWSLELPSGKLIWSDFHKKMWGYEQNLDMLHYEDWHRIIHPDDAPLAMAAVENALLTRQTYMAEYRIFRANDGAVRWMRSVGQYFFDPVTDEPYKLTGVSYDITARKTFEGELRRRVDEQTEELKTINEQMERFSFVAAHDLQSPLRKIEMFSGLLRECDGDQLSASGHTYLDKITSAAKRMRNLVNALLQLSKIKSDQRNFQPVDTQGLMNNILDAQELSIQEEDAIIEISHPLPPVWGAQWQLDILFSNLLANSLKFTKPGVQPHIFVSGRVLDQAEAAQRVRHSDRAYALFTIEDNGLGFEQAFAENMFEMFKRLHEDVPGTGMGLAMCKQVADNHLGQIKAFGTPGKGAKFEILLPMPEPAMSGN